MADPQNIDWLTDIANRAGKDASRARELRQALQIISDNSTGALVTFTVDFIGADQGYLADAECGRTLKAMWPVIWEATMKSATAELEAIVKRYQPLLNEVPSDG